MDDQFARVVGTVYIGCDRNGLSASSRALANQSRKLGTALSGSILGTIFHALAEGFAATTTGLQSSWVTANETAANGALAIEAFWNGTVRLCFQTAAKTRAGAAATRIALVSSAEKAQDGWVSANRVVATVALSVEDSLKATISQLGEILHSIQAKGVEFGISKDTVQSSGRNIMDGVISSYHALDRGAESLGYFLDDLLRRISAKFTEGRSGPKL